MLYPSFTFRTRKEMYVTYIPKRKGGNSMAIVSGYTPHAYTASPHTQPQQTQQKILQKPEQDLSQKAPERVPKTAPEKQPEQQLKQQLEQVDKSTKRFALRLTQKQRNQIKKLQKSWSLSTESAVIKKLIDDSKEENNSNDLALKIEELTQIKAELNRIGININQIAKKANQIGMTMDDLNAVMKYMNDVCEVIYGKGLR